MSFFVRFNLRMEIVLQLCYVLFRQFSIFFSTSELPYSGFGYNEIFFMTSGLRFLVVPSHYVRK